MSSRASGFLFATLLAIFVVAVLLASGYVRSGMQALVQQGEDQNVILARAVSNAMQPELARLLQEVDDGSTGRHSADRMALYEETVQTLDRVIRDTPIVWVRIYNNLGQMAMSTGKLDILAAESFPEDMTDAISGSAASNLRVLEEHTDAGDVIEHRVIESYIPFSWNRRDGTEVRGVFELYSDTRDHLLANRYIDPVTVVGVTFAIMALLYLVIIALYLKYQRTAVWRESVEKREKLLERVSSRFIEAQEEERRKIGRDIHDEAGQWLSVLKFRLEGLAEQVGTGTAVQQEEVVELLELVQKSIRSIRSVAMQLRPPILDDLGLQAALGWLVRTSNEMYKDLNIELQVELDEADVPSHIKTSVFRVVQEAISNIGRHSEADNGYIVLKRDNHSIQLDIRDDGKGMDLAHLDRVEAENGGFGLGSMRERVQVCGGTVRVQSTPGNGVSILATWPVTD